MRVEHCRRSSVMAFAFLAVCLFQLSVAVTLTQKYAQGPISMDKNVNLSFSVDFSKRTISFGLVVINERYKDNTGPAWLGLGISEKSSGSMLGSDIATAAFKAGDVDKCKVVDRYVPFAAFPLLESRPGSPAVFPKEDKCQDDGSWKLVACNRDLKTGTLIFEVSRSLNANDGQDRKIGPGLQKFIYSYGGSFRYHGSSRGSRTIAFYTADNKIADNRPVPLPKSVSGSQEIVATRYTVPSNVTTTYACTSVVGEVGPSGQRTVIAAEPILKQVSGKNKAHHFLLYGCEDTEYFRFFKKTAPCDAAGGGPLGNPRANCTALFFGWAVGGTRILLPKDTGIIMNNKNKFLILETHYDNPDGDTKAVDMSGARLFYADQPPKQEAGFLVTGDTAVSLYGRKVKSNFEYEHTCPAACTRNFKQPLNIFSSGLHMHTTGKSIWTNQFASNGKFKRTINKVEFWSNDHQGEIRLNPNAIVNPGDILSTTCVYDTSKKPNTIFGAETKDEMCVDFMIYWPVQRRSPEDGSLFHCGPIYRRSRKTGKDRPTLVVCGPFSRRGILNTSYVNFKDNVNTPNKFGIPGKDVCVKAASPKPSSNVNASPKPGAASQSPSGSSSENACFPADASVMLRGGIRRPMEELDIDDEVLVGNDLFSKVFLFTHKIIDGTFEFLEIGLSDGNTLTLTKSHYVYINGKSQPAETVMIGDSLEDSAGLRIKVTRVKRVYKRGLYNPQTFHGDIIVNGIRASTYTRTVDPKVAHSVLTPVRCAHKFLGASMRMIESGAPYVVRMTKPLRDILRE